MLTLSLELVVTVCATLLVWALAIFAKKRRRTKALDALFEELIGDVARLGTIAGEPNIEEKIRQYRERYNESVQ